MPLCFFGILSTDDTHAQQYLCAHFGHIVVIYTKPLRTKRSLMKAHKGVLERWLAALAPSLTPDYVCLKFVKEVHKYQSCHIKIIL